MGKITIGEEKVPQHSNGSEPPPPQSLLFSLRSTSNSSLLFTFRPKRFLLLRPCSSLKEVKKQTTLLKGTIAPQSLRRFLNPKSDGDDADDGQSDVGVGRGGGDGAVKGTLLAGLLLVGVVGGFGSVGYIYKDQINAFLTQFSGFIEGKFCDIAMPISAF